jgi:hypothetical protein
MRSFALFSAFATVALAMPSPWMLEKRSQDNASMCSQLEAKYPGSVSSVGSQKYEQETTGKSEDPKRAHR